MAAAPRSTPTTRMRELAERLRELRLAKDLTVEAVAANLLVSASKISRLETAARRASPRDVRDLCLLYGVSLDERDRLMSLAAQALETSWYQDAEIDADYETFVGLEQAASDISVNHAHLVPGLLQTEAYARALLSVLRPPGQLTPDRIDEIVRVRLRRQMLLTSANPPKLHVVLDESVFRRMPGDERVGREQINAVLERMDLANLVVQIVPQAVRVHPGLDGRFAVLRFADSSIRDTVYIEGLLGQLFLDKDSDVSRYLEIFDFLTQSVALSERSSRELLSTIRSELSPSN
ncbi:helix-turn-helix transcriptional regulator [Kineosporia sp. A_224]|uniref:helix-turn-helix domain-containing protein n=1 Tax=Kineosporia sp. A_224 TaxID=1962180 RepID=UPI000B4B8D5C|nr:helix-turn-helix transcriptional regulator [Kineosporia sp. A_224]